MKPFTRKPKANYAFVDSQNLNLGVQKVGWKMDWRKFREFLREKYNVDTAYLFIGYMPENEDMYKQLHDAGYLIVLKPTIAGGIDYDKDGTMKKLVKGNIDAELVLYAMKEMPNYSKAIIVSGDGDFLCLAEYLAGKGRLEKIMTPNWQYSSLLKPYEDYILRLDGLKQELQHKDFRNKKRTNNRGRQNNNAKSA